MRTKNPLQFINLLWTLNCLLAYYVWMPTPLSFFIALTIWIGLSQLLLSHIQHSLLQKVWIDPILSTAITVVIVILLLQKNTMMAIYITSIDLILISIILESKRKTLWRILLFIHMLIISISFLKSPETNPLLIIYPILWITYLGISFSALFLTLYYSIYHENNTNTSPHRITKNQLKPQKSKNKETKKSHSKNASEIAIKDPHTACVAFIDLVNYQTLTNNLDASTLVDILNNIFSYADENIITLGLQKIKIIGDAYLVTSINPQINSIKIIEFIFQMHCWLKNFSLTIQQDIQLHAGVASGPIIGSKIGHLNPCYDIWGKAVNSAHYLCRNAPSNTIFLDELTKKYIEEYLFINQTSFTDPVNNTKIITHEIILQNAHNIFTERHINDRRF